ncbi:Starch-binding associating with outer membrane [Zunongwangia mangrovi]|uniref:Starch-binding associating with outer membrane n=1 Tax=Zunongwangia mangrovi TaxID=1334022 RepID=A0A1I1JXB7_9FLAO|nr:SusD/RagB family nutrient-binding outer membrane lipoprotein [Zunongwangia mangrovi]SFC52632.1 Starch-binding associating with outer membrane [Zunongwangia mangrovi]
MMKKIYIILFLALAFQSCDNFDEDININPNLPSQASGTQLIANAELYLPGLSSSPRGEFFAQYLAETQYVGTSLYPQESTSFYSYYQGPLENLQTVLNNQDNLSSTEGPVNNQVAVAKILRAYFYWNVTDRWGDIPYNEALMGSENFTPSYDTQESIYLDLFEELKEATSIMVSGSISNDIVYDGDMENWRLLANTIRLFMALRLSEVDPDLAQAEFADALDDGVIMENADNLVYYHLAEANNQNYWYGQIVDRNREWWALTEKLVTEMLPYNDPRLQVYGDPARASDAYVGLRFGEEEAIGTEEYSLLGSDIYAQDAPVYLVTSAQVYFAIAEAVSRGWVAGSAEENYNMAIEQSIMQWTGSDAGVTSFLNQPEVAFDSSNAIESIANQRWVHLYMHGYEAWSEWRRTGFPAGFESPNGAEIPLRLSYPDNESFNNSENYEEAVSRQFDGEDLIYGQVWWDQ